MVAQHLDSLGDGSVLGRNGPGLTAGTEVLPRIEAESCHIAVRANASPLVAAPLCLSGILNYPEAVTGPDVRDGVQVRRLSV